MESVHSFFEASDYQAALERSRRLRRRCRENPEELGWAVYYEFRCLYALGRTTEAWELLHSEDRRLSRIDVKNDGWMCSVGSELAARLGRVEDVARLGEECLMLRRELGDPRSEVMCCQTVCTLLQRLCRPDRNRDFAQHLVTLGIRFGSARTLASGVGFLIDGYEHTPAPALREALRVASIQSPELRARIEKAIGKIAPSPSYRAPSKRGDTLDQRLFVRELASRNRRDPVTVRGFARLSLLVQHGFEHVGYDSHVLEDGCLFWITDAHAAAIGGCLSASLRSFHLSLTTFAGEGFDVMTEAASDDVELDKLVIHHRSGDEVTVEEARGLARLVTKLRVRNLSVWALEYESDALDALATELERVNNETLTGIDICDLTRAEPDDRVLVPVLDALIAKNRAA